MARGYQIRDRVIKTNRRNDDDTIQYEPNQVSTVRKESKLRTTK